MYGSDTNDNGTGHPDKNDNNPPKGADKNDNSEPESMETTTNGDNANKKPEPTSMEATTCTNNSNGNMNLQPLETNNLHVIDNLRSQTRNTDNASSDVNGNPSTRPTPVEGDNNLEGAAAATSEEASATKVVGPIVIEATMEESETDTSSTTSATEDIENMEALDLSAHGSSACVRETYHPPSPMDLEPAAVPSQPHVMFQTEVCNALSRVQQGTTSGAAQVQQIEAPALEQVQEEVIPERQQRIEVAPQSCRMTQNQTQQGLPLRPSVIQHTSTLAENAPFNAKPPQRDAFLRELLSKPVPEDPVKKTFDKLYRETPSGSGNPTSGQPGPSAIPGPSTQPGPSAQPGPSTSAQPGASTSAQRWRRREARWKILKPSWNVETVYESQISNNEGNNALHSLVSYEYDRRTLRDENKKILRLLQRGFDVNRPNDQGSAPLHLAILNGNFEALDYLMAFGGDINIRDKNGRTPIFHVESEEQLAECLRYKPRLNVVDNEGYNVIQYLLTSLVRDLEPFLLLIRHGADCKNINHEGNNCLHTMAEYNEIDEVEGEYAKITLTWALVRRGTEINGQNLNLETPLHKAVAFDPEFVRAYLEAGADLTIVDKTKQTPLDLAFERKHCLQEIVRFLVFKKHRGLPVSSDQMESIRSDSRGIEFLMHYEGIMENLKRSKIIPSATTTFYDIIKSNRNELMKIVKNNEMREVFRVSLHKCNDDYFESTPLEYEREIKRIVKKGDHMIEQEEAYEILEKIMKHKLPALCVRKIISFLSPCDVRHLLHSNFLEWTVGCSRKSHGE